MENVTQSANIPPGVKIALYSLLLPCSLIGNVLVIATVYANAPLRTKFNFIIVNMALSDLVIPVLVLPQQIVLEARGNSNEWLVGGSFGNVLCKIFYFMADISPGVSVLSLVVIAVNRFFAIVYPLRFNVFSRKKLFCMIALTWIISMIIFSPHLYTFRLIPGPPYDMCYVSWEPLDPDKSTTVFYSIFVIALFVVPFLIISVLYTILTYKIYKTSERIQSMLNNEQAELRQRRNKQVFYMSVVVVLAFALLWGPFFGFLFTWVFIWGKKFPTSVLIQLPNIKFVLNFVGFSNSMVNPCVYFVFMKNFRQGLRKIFRRNLTNAGIPLAELTTMTISSRYKRNIINKA